MTDRLITCVVICIILALVLPRQNYDAPSVPKNIMWPESCYKVISMPYPKFVSIFGRHFNDLERIRKESGARIQLDTFVPPKDKRERERTVLINGGVEQVKIATKMIDATMLFYESYDPYSVRPLGKVIRMPYPKFVSLFGMNGANIARIENESGAWIQLSVPPKDRRAGEKTLIIYGTVQQVLIAMKMIHTIVYENYDASSVPTDIMLTESFRNLISMPYSNVVSPFGMNGANIERIKKESGAWITQLAPFFTLEDWTEEYTVSIIGGVQEVEIAMEMINAIVSENHDASSVPTDIMLTKSFRSLISMPYPKFVALFGMNGANLERIENESGAWITQLFVLPMDWRAGEINVTIYGTVQEVKIAMEMINAIVYEVPVFPANEDGLRIEEIGYNDIKCASLDVARW